MDDGTGEQLPPRHEGELGNGMRSVSKDDLVKDEDLVAIGAGNLDIPLVLGFVARHQLNAGVKPDVLL